MLENRVSSKLGSKWKEFRDGVKRLFHSTSIQRGNSELLNLSSTVQLTAEIQELNEREIKA